ncbi:MAG: hypothetical protein JO135_10480 [Candidatus Eremiobacteraeota bacterium]|nr:hypothetical protein [Candidatus Eremiobacteraeota bacterium]
MNKVILALLVLVLTQFGSITPAVSQQILEIVHVNVIVTNKETNEPMNGLTVLYDADSNCNGERHDHVVGRTSRSLVGQGGAQGEAEISLIACTGPATITVEGGSEFDTQTKEIQIVQGQYRYNVFVQLESKGRVVHIRVQGRSEKGELIPVRALVYDRNGQRIAMTDEEGLATAQVPEALGETVTLRAEAPHWRSGTASYIAGAYHSGSRITRSEDYVNIVLGEQEQTKQEIQLSIMVKGTKGENPVPIEHALIYDGEGHYLTSTDARGHAAAIVEAPFGETFRLRAEATRWKSETQTLLARSETKNSYAGRPGSKYLFHQVRFLLEPATNEVNDLIVEVLDRDTDKPVAAASVHLYKPTGFPGLHIAAQTTNHSGEAMFNYSNVEHALLQGEAHVGVTHRGYEDALQTVPVSLTTAELPRYVVYLKPKQPEPAVGKDTWSGTWTFVGVNGGAVILQQTGSVVQGHLNVRGQDYPTFTLKISGATATGIADVGAGGPGPLKLTIFGKRFTGTFSAAGRDWEPDGYCHAGDCLKNR